MNRRAEHSFREVTGATDALLSSFRGIASGAEELLRATAHLSGEGLAATRAKVADQVEHVRETLNDADTYAREQAGKAVAGTNRYVRDNPWRAIGISMAIGIALGFLSARRR